MNMTIGRFSINCKIWERCFQGECEARSRLFEWLTHPLHLVPVSVLTWCVMKQMTQHKKFFICHFQFDLRSEISSMVN